MNREKQKSIIVEALKDFFSSEDGEALIGNIAIKALAQHLNSYEWEMEKHGKDGSVKVETIQGNVLAYISQWIKNAEGAVRGVQADADQARNRSAEAARGVAAIFSAMERRGTVDYIEISNPLPAIGNAEKQPCEGRDCGT